MIKIIVITLNTKVFLNIPEQGLLAHLGLCHISEANEAIDKFSLRPSSSFKITIKTLNDIIKTKIPYTQKK